MGFPMYSRSHLIQIEGEVFLGVPFPQLTKEQESAGSSPIAFHKTRPIKAELHPKEKWAVQVSEQGVTGKDVYVLKMNEGFTHSCFGRSILWYGDYLVISAPRADISIEGEPRWRTDAGMVSVWHRGQLLANYTCSAAYNKPAMFGAHIWIEGDKLMTWWRFAGIKNNTQVASHAIGEIPIKDLIYATEKLSNSGSPPPSFSSL